ncbi:nucleoside deaminase [Alphaproteobacteria bacterium]|jgi:tRNA(adenine34) deaminase|nr:nucleoside deaminase [Alphaproteobacteria bacterium]
MEKTFMEIALEQAILAGEAGEVPVGAVIVDKVGNVIAHGQNSMRRLKDPTAHAEIVAIREAGIQLKNERLMECDLYVTLEPCTMCAGAISLARLRRLYYAASDTKTGAVDNGVAFFNQSSCHHKPETYGGILERQSADLLRSFFEMRRNNPSF